MLPTGLQRHRKSGTYYLRRRIPNDLLTCYPGKKEIVFSLRTKDYRSALERHRDEEARLTAEWREKRQQATDSAVRQQLQAVMRIDSLTPDNIEAICRHAEAASLAGDERRRESETPYSLEEVEEYQGGYLAANRVLKAAVAIGDHDLLRGPLEQFLQLYRYRVTGSDADMRRLALAFGRAAIRTNEKLLNRYDGNDEPTPVFARKLDTPMLSEVIHSYQNYYRKLDKPAMLRKVNTVMSLLLDVVGDKPIGSLTQTDLENYLETVQKLPPRWSDMCRREGISVQALAGQERGEMSEAAFIGTYLAAITPFLKYCRRKWQDSGWPMTITTEGVRYIGHRKDPKGRQRNFTAQELNRLFSGPEMLALARNPSEAHKFWLPHLGLFTGARVNELCQLNPQTDIRKDASGIWFLDITDESASDEKVEKSVKTEGSRRKVPIHPTLIELGFLRYIERLQAQRQTLLFPGFQPVAGKASPKAGVWFRDFLRAIGLRDETPNARVVGMHAFRSTFLHQAMILDVANAEAITGHSSSVTEIETSSNDRVDLNASPVVKKYRGEFPVVKKLEILAKINFGELRFYTPVSTGKDKP